MVNNLLMIMRTPKAYSIKSGLRQTQTDGTSYLPLTVTGGKIGRIVFRQCCQHILTDILAMAAQAQGQHRQCLHEAIFTIYFCRSKQGGAGFACCLTFIEVLQYFLLPGISNRTAGVARLETYATYKPA